jgi:hypothetical protein
VDLYIEDVIIIPTFDDLSKLESYLLAQISKVMDNEVAEVIKKEESNQIKKYYRKFRPKMYIRREDNDGLSDIRNMRSKTVRNAHSVKTTITNETHGNPDYSESQTVLQNLAGVFASGQGYNYHGENSKYYEVPRPANQDAVEELQRNRRHISALIAGLKTLGIQAE